tara:strand:- start:4242 stop:4706 length:465 start_codon:yes stop_codon:yes gene_type:complete
LKKISLTIISLSLLILSSCNNSRNLKYLSGYWEIYSVKKDNNKIKNYPFSGTIDYFELSENFSEGFRKKVKPRIDGNFDITMHQINFNIDEEKKHLRFFKFDLNFSNSIKLIYGQGENFTENVVKIDSMNLIITNLDGLTYEYKRFYPKNYLDE